MSIPEKTLVDLQWGELMAQLAKRTTGSEAKEICENTTFFDEPESVKSKMEVVWELVRLIDDDDPVPLLPARPARNWHGMIRLKAALPVEALLDIANNLKLFVRLSKFFINRYDTCPQNTKSIEINGNLESWIGLSRLADEIIVSFDPDGTVSDNASPHLASLRRKVVSLRGNLISMLDEIAQDASDLLQDTTCTVRGGRLVLPVRTDAHRKFNGIVHATSGSGATCFIEPQKTVSAGNELILAKEEVKREEARIIKALCQAVADEIDLVEVAHEKTVKMDVITANAKLAWDMDAVVPQIIQPGEIDLKNAKHPLLLLGGTKTIGNSFKIDSKNAMVISGPNAGGKTVCLKTVGLLALMVKAGMPIPADEGSKIGLAYSVQTDMGDDSDLLQNLSTFSGHMSNIARVIEVSKKGTIVLLDEIAAGTDPMDGASLALAILTKLMEQKTSILATTHFDAVKTKIADSKYFSNASMGFNSHNLTPTFVMTPGVPGISNAFETARRYGIADEIIEKANGFLPKGVQNLKKATRLLEEEKQLLENMRTSLEKELRQAEAKKAQYENELTKIKAKSIDKIDSQTQSLWVSIHGARKKIAEVEKSLRRKKLSPDVLHENRVLLNKTAKVLDEKGITPGITKEEIKGRPAKTEDIVMGKTLVVGTYNKFGIVESKYKGGKVTVRMGNIPVSVKLKDLYVPDGNNIKPAQQNKPSARTQLIKKPKKTKVSNEPRDFTDAFQTTENTLDLRGMDSYEAVNATDAFCDLASRKYLNFVFIIHGHGTGALKSAIRQYALESPYVKNQRPGNLNEGGDGVTIFEI